jgi:hypothetical protein
MGKAAGANTTNSAQYAGKPAGRPESHPERKAWVTLRMIDGLRQWALRLAQLDPKKAAAKVEGIILGVVPLELRSAFRPVVERHLPYIPGGSLSPEETTALVRASGLLSQKDREELSNEETGLVERRADLLARLHGKNRIIKEEVQKSGPSMPSAFALDVSRPPAYLRGLWRRLDEWGAAKHNTTVRTFRSWRTKLRQSKELEAPEAGPRGRRTRVHRH